MSGRARGAEGEEGERPAPVDTGLPDGWRASVMLPAVDEPFLTSAPSRFVDTIEAALPADTVWAELTRDGTLDWCRGLQITWLTPRPFGVGTKRQAKLLGVLLRVQEEYFIWEEGRRMAFFVKAVRPAAYRRAAEDYVVEALGPDRCRFTWTLAFELTLLASSTRRSPR
jgi:Polyketide cyclase / dehydrase and lipid transport